ncbi:hypothetical protein QN239_31600 [Mycolicibacterium sp. Y3]
MPRQAAELAAAKEQHDKPENRVVRDGIAICRQCGLGWDNLVHGC